MTNFIMALEAARSQLLVKQYQGAPQKTKSLTSWWKR